MKRIQKGKINGENNRRIQNSSELYQMMKGVLWNREIHKQYKTTKYKIYFKPILTCDAKIWILTGRKAKFKQWI
jgi:hypothetical protein